MSDEIALTRAVDRAARAQRLLDDDLLKEALETLERSYIERWRATHIDDDKGREKLFLAVNVVAKVRDHLTLAVSNGSVAKTELDNLARDAQRKKRFGIV